MVWQFGVRRSTFGALGSVVPVRVRARSSRLADRAVIECARELPVPKNGHPVAEAKDFGQPVRDAQDRHAPASQIVQHAKQVVGFGRRQRGRWLVEHEHATIERERARDLHELAVGRRQVLHRRLGRERRAAAPEDRASEAACLVRAAPRHGLSSRPAKMLPATVRFGNVTIS